MPAMNTAGGVHVNRDKRNFLSSHCNISARYTASLMMTTQQTKQIHLDLTTAHHDFQKGLNSHAYFKLNDHAMGEDLVQGTFTKTWSYLLKGGKIDVMKAFLYHVLNNLIVDEYRKHKTTSLDVLLEKGFEPSHDNSKRLLAILDGKAAIVLIKQLPEKYQKVMQMRFIQLLSLKEISILTDQTRNAVAVQVHRGLGKLKLLYHAA